MFHREGLRIIIICEGVANNGNARALGYLREFGDYTRWTLNCNMEKQKIYPIDWERYLQPKRLRVSGTQASVEWDTRNQFESDFGRVVFCPAIRRMHDKTQVIPLTSGDTILTRLTHSMQVMNVAESLAHFYTRTDSFVETYGNNAWYYDASISAIKRN